MKPFAFFFTQYTDYSRLFEEQSKITSPDTYQGGQVKRMLKR
jgi:hypothetical protein